MEMTIDENIEYLKDFDSYSPYQEAIDKVSAYIEQMQADYENRLKADLEAILVEFQLEISELKSYESVDGQDLVMLADIGTLFQQKINNLKED